MAPHAPVGLLRVPTVKRLVLAALAAVGAVAVACWLAARIPWD